MKIYHNFKQTLVEASIWKAFQALGFEFDTGIAPCQLLLNERTLRESAGLQEL
jgi:hypothetical protein